MFWFLLSESICDLKTSKTNILYFKYSTQIIKSKKIQCFSIQGSNVSECKYVTTGDRACCCNDADLQVFYFYLFNYNSLSKLQYVQLPKKRSFHHDNLPCNLAVSQLYLIFILYIIDDWFISSYSISNKQDSDKLAHFDGSDGRFLIYTQIPHSSNEPSVCYHQSSASAQRTSKIFHMNIEKNWSFIRLHPHRKLRSFAALQGP